MSDLTKENATEKLSDLNSYDKFEQGATFLGVVCIKDPVRAEIKPAIKDCKTAGIRVIMITGDSKETAVAIAKEINIIDNDDDPNEVAFTGAQFNAMTP